jgi:hypothetical protein
MADRAQVTSVEALEAFRANLIVYLSKARPALEEVSGDVQRAKQWLQNDQRQLWLKELRTRGRKLEEAQNELFTAKISQDSGALEQMNAQRAQRAVRQAEEKLAVLRKWDRELENRSEPFLKQLDQLHSFLTTELPKASAHLAGVVKTLEAYADVPRPGGATVTPPAAAPKPAPGGAAS